MKQILVLILYAIGVVAILGIPVVFMFVQWLWAASRDSLMAATIFIPAVIFLGWFARRMLIGARDIRRDIVNEIHSENS